MDTLECEGELAEVRKELVEVEAEINSLLERQSYLLKRQEQLESAVKRKTTEQNQDKKWETSNFPWSKELEEKMKSVFKISSLRAMQLQTMNVTMSGKDCMLIMPTGGGKSLCFQLPAVLSKGITLVVSPLVSLMEDQVMALETLGVEAAMLNASCDKQTVNAIQAAMLDKKSSLRLLYVTPEKLAKSKRFMNKLEKMYEMQRLARLVIDEVHCCSQWGHDFRPDYKFLGIMKRQFPSVPILGLTATATSNVLEDVKKILNIPHCLLFKASFNRPNLYYEVRPKSSVAKEALDDIQHLINKKFKDQSGIIYCLSRKESEDVAYELKQRGIKAAAYHADLSAKERSAVHKCWLSNKIKIVVATVAFGMGIDKPDVRFVIHHSLSKSMENLYQESGRAGRDSKESHCIVFYRFTDVFRQSTMVFTEQTGLKNLYGIMEYCSDVARCRRAVIARHFGEVWDSSQCNKMCDHCDRADNVTMEKKDITKLCQNVLTIIDHASSTNQRITALKLIESWQGKGAASFKVKGLETATVPKDRLERILAHMLLKDYLQEDFHFTAYSTNSYLVQGPKSRQVRTGMVNVVIDFPQKKYSSEKTKTAKKITSPSNGKITLNEQWLSTGKSNQTSPQKGSNSGSQEKRFTPSKDDQKNKTAKKITSPSNGKITLKEQWLSTGKSNQTSPQKGSNSDLQEKHSTPSKDDQRATTNSKHLSVTKGKYHFKKIRDSSSSEGNDSSFLSDCKNSMTDDTTSQKQKSSTSKYKFKKVRRTPDTVIDSDEEDVNSILSAKLSSGERGTDSQNSQGKKRKFVISDSDSDDLDFGTSDSFKSKPARKQKTGSGVKTTEKESSRTESPICIDSDSD